MQTALGLQSRCLVSATQSGKQRLCRRDAFQQALPVLRPARPLSGTSQLRAVDLDLEDTDVLSSVNFEHSEEVSFGAPQRQWLKAHIRTKSRGFLILKHSNSRISSCKVQQIILFGTVNLLVQVQGEYCMPGQVSLQNDDGPYTLISMQVSLLQLTCSALISFQQRPKRPPCDMKKSSSLVTHCLQCKTRKDLK